MLTRQIRYVHVHVPDNLQASRDSKCASSFRAKAVPDRFGWTVEPSWATTPTSARTTNAPWQASESYTIAQDATRKGIAPEARQGGARELSVAHARTTPPAWHRTATASATHAAPRSTYVSQTHSFRVLPPRNDASVACPVHSRLHPSGAAGAPTPATKIARRNSYLQSPRPGGGAKCYK